MVVNKPAGLAAQDIANSSIMLASKGLLPVNRIDQRVSGIILFARNNETLAVLNDAFKNRTITKLYRAIVANHPPQKEEMLVQWLVKNGIQSKSKVFAKEVAHSKKAVMFYKLIQSSERFHLLEIKLDTGRFHQIRAQLSSIACPILGDVKYGFKRTMPDGSIFLQSYHLQFIHPKTSQLLTFEIDMPELWKKYGF